MLLQFFTAKVWSHMVCRHIQWKVVMQYKSQHTSDVYQKFINFHEFRSMSPIRQ